MSGFFCTLHGNTLTSDPAPTWINNRYAVLFSGTLSNKAEWFKRLRLTFQQSYVGNEWLIVRLYEQFRKELPLHLRGTYTFILWDAKEKVLFAARDPFGSGRLFYRQEGELFRFATTKQALIQQQERTHLCPIALQQYFAFQYVPEQYSLRGDIQALPPGHFAHIDGGHFTVQAFKTLTFRPLTKDVTAFTKATRQLLTLSVKRQLQDVSSVGAFLSGGIDSTSIVTLAKQFRPDIKTFTVGFRENGYSEIELAAATAHELGVTHLHKTISAEECLAHLPEIIQQFDEPLADPAMIPLYFAANVARKHADVILSGEGADELFGGYHIYREPFSLRSFQHVPLFIKRWLRALSLRLPEGMKGKSFLWRGTTPLEERYLGNANIFTEAERKELLIKYRADISYTDITKELFAQAQAFDDSTKMQYIDIHTWLVGDILANANQIAAAHALQFRYPFLDVDLFDFVRQLPTEVKLAKRTTKYVLRKAMEDIIPEATVYRKKLGFPVPIRHWLRNEWYDWARTTLEGTNTERLIKREVALNYLDEHATNKRDHSRKLWAILVFTLWYQLQSETKTSGAVQRQSTWT